MLIIDLADQFGDEEPSEEMYKKAVQNQERFISLHSNDKIISRMRRRVYCPRCRSQMEIDVGVCICNNCKGWVVDDKMIVMRDGTLKTVYECNPELEEVNRQRFKEYDFLDKKTD